MAHSLEARLERLEAATLPRRRNCFVGVMPGEDAEQKVAAYVAEHGEQPLGVIHVHFVAPPPRDEDGHVATPQEKHDGIAA